MYSGETARRAGIFAGYFTGIDRQHEGFSQYTVTTSDFDDLWDDAFVNTLRNATVAQQGAIDAGITGVGIGITQSLQAMAFGSTSKTRVRMSALISWWSRTTAMSPTTI